MALPGIVKKLLMLSHSYRIFFSMKTAFEAGFSKPLDGGQFRRFVDIDGYNPRHAGLVHRDTQQLIRHLHS